MQSFVPRRLLVARCYRSFFASRKVTGGPQWRAYEVDANHPNTLRPTVEVRWNTFEVRHQHATSEWLIAVDRDGTIWNARASRAPWL